MYKHVKFLSAPSMLKLEMDVNAFLKEYEPYNIEIISISYTVDPDGTHRCCIAFSISA